MYKYDNLASGEVRQALEESGCKKRLQELYDQYLSECTETTLEEGWELYGAGTPEVWLLEIRYYPRLVIFFEKLIRDRIDHTFCIRPEDLATEFCAACLVDKGHFELAYKVFLSSVQNRIFALLSSRPFVIGQIPKKSLVRAFHESIAEPADSFPFELWEMKGITVSVFGTGIAETKGLVPPQFWGPILVLYARVAGIMSATACDHLGKELQRVLCSVMRSVSLLAGVHGMLSDENSRFPSRPTPWLSEPFMSDWSRDEPATGYPALTLDVISEYQPLIKYCLNCYFSRPGKKQTLDQRVRNALLLLAEADRQEMRGAVGLALSCAALEAMACDTKEGVARTLAENTAALLEPNAKLRPEAINVIKALYDQRSKALHGTDIKDDEAEREKARHLAACVLKAIFDRQEFVRRLGDEQSVQDLFQELKYARETGTAIVGVEESPATRLWRR